MGVPRGIRYGNLLVPPSGNVDIPGGLVARIASGAAGQTLPFPIVGAFDDGQLTPVVFVDTGPTPLYEEKVDGGGRGFPKVTLTGIPAGTFIAYQVAQTADAARFLASGGQLATDVSGRLVVVGGDAPSKATFSLLAQPSAAGAFAILGINADGGKKVRIRRVRFEWPGKQTAGAKAGLQLTLDKNHLVTAPANAAPAVPLDVGSTDVMASHAWLTGTVPVTGFSLDAPFIFIPGADGLFTPWELDFDKPLSGMKPVIVPVGGSFSISWQAGFPPGAGYDGLATLTVFLTEE